MTSVCRRRRGGRVELIALLLLFCVGLCGATGLEVKVRLLPEHSGAAVPVAVKLAEPIPDRGLYSLEDAASGARLPFQHDRASGMIEFMLDVPVIARPVTKTLRLAPGAPLYGDGMWVRDSGARSLVVREGDRQVFAYNYGSLLPDGVPEKFRRSSYIHPLFGPYGEALTDDFPADHYHHRGVAVMWTHVTVGGRMFDLWALNGIKPRFGRVLAMEDGPVYSLLRVNDGWYTADGQRVVDETWTVKTYRAGQYGRIIDFEILLRAVGEPVTVKSSDRGYGGFNVRFAPREETILFSEKGRVPADTDKQAFLWNDLSARFKGAEAVSGLAIFDNPGNIRHPQPWTNRYYGFLNPAPAAVEPLSFSADKPLRLQYRMWVHAGDVEAGKVAQAYKAYVSPPSVEVE